MTTATHTPGDWLSEALSYGKDNEISRLRSEREELIAALRILCSSCDTNERNGDGSQRGVRTPNREHVEQARVLLSRLKP